MSRDMVLLLRWVAFLAIIVASNLVLWKFFPPGSLAAKSNLDPPPGPYTWSRINPEPNLTCLVVEAQYHTHPITMWCQEVSP